MTIDIDHDLEGVLTGALHSVSVRCRVIAKRIRSEHADASKGLTPDEAAACAVAYAVQLTDELQHALCNDMASARRLLDRAREADDPRQRQLLARASRRLLQERADDHASHDFGLENEDEVTALLTVIDGEFPTARPGRTKPLTRPRARPARRRPMVKR